MTTNEITPAVRLTIVKHLANGKDLTVVALITKLSREQVLDVASHHGYPDTDKLAWAADVLKKNIADEQTAALPRPTAVPAASPTRPAAGASTPPAAGLSSQPSELHTLVDRGKQHPSKRIQAAANRVLDDLDRLRTLLREDESKHAEKRKADAAKAAARAEVQRLEAQLAEAKSKLRGNTANPKAAKAASDGPSSADVRAWAAENDVQCPAVGRVPGSVLEAYEAAHLQAAS